jgi:glycosyltransferase involved in cell wall biosynthesis
MAIKLAILVTHPIQYFAPVFRELAKQADLQLKVFFGCNHGIIPREDPNFGVVFKWDCQPTEGFEHEFLSTDSLATLRGFAGIKLSTKAITSINHYQPDFILIFSYSPAFITASTILLRLTGQKLMLRAETTDEALSRSFFKDKIRQTILSVYYRQFTHFFPIGSNSLNHFLRMGVTESRMTKVLYAIDTVFFQTQIDYWLPQRQELRANLSIKEKDHVFIYCGKIFDIKNPLIIPDSLALLSSEEKAKIWFLAVGDGELRQDFEKRVKAELGERAVFVGFKNQSELGEYYAMADTLILPSQSGETWGLVVNEALQFGLRVIVSDKVGSSKDLINNGNGWIFKSGSSHDLAKILSEAIVTTRCLSVNFENLPHPDQLAQSIYKEVNSYD